MRFRLELKAIGLGLATFVAGSLLMTIVGISVGTLSHPSIGKTRWALIQIIGYLVPVAAGYVAAYYAQTRRILHGTVGGSVGVLLLLSPALLVPGYDFRGVPILLVFYAAFASLGAIVGNHRRSRVGP